MLKKICYSPSAEIKTERLESVLASTELVERMNKLAKEIKAIAPKSDDFLYFSIIFLKAAESSLLDDSGSLKKLSSGEEAWGFFDENWRWHGNVKPHKNNNCFVPGTLIQMMDGSVKNIEDITVGDLVITHTGAIKPVVALMKNDFSGKVLKINSRNNSSVVCTSEHPFYSIKTGGKGLRSIANIKEKDLNFSFNEIGSLEVGDILTSNVDIKTNINQPSDLNVDTARLLGIFAAEGSYSKKYGKRQAVNFTLGINEKSQANLIVELFAREFPECNVIVKSNEKRSVINVTASGHNIAEFFHQHVGEFSHEKKLSMELVYSTDAVKKSFLTGWLDGDGCLSDSNKLVGITTSKDLAYQIRLMLNSMHVMSSLRTIKSKGSFVYPDSVDQVYKDKKYQTRDHYRIEIYGKGYKQLNLDENSIKYTFDDSLSIKNYNYVRAGYRLHSISSIEEVDYSGSIYNFQVQDDNSYIANGLIVHNCDIFPESELKVAAKKWIGMPLCRDHESSSVDGIRGIILDAHYDEKFKQVVGLCALDKKNYPDLARKVETGLVRYGSMGTAVETSVCSECGNKAATQKEYCQHVLTRTAHGEINVGLKPIEYSLVVQPAEPGAILLKCLASLDNYRKEFISYGVDDVDSMLGRLSEKQAQHLDTIMKNACGEDGCSIPQRKRIVKSFLSNNGLIKKEGSDDLTSFAHDQNNGIISERFTDVEAPAEERNIQSGVSTSSNMLGGKGLESFNDFESSNKSIKDKSNTSDVPATSVASLKNDLEKVSINKILEDIMSQTNLKRRAEERRKIAYMQGGDSVDDKNYREPAGFKSDKMSETVRNTQDKHLLQDGDMNKLTREDMALKEKLSRAALAEARLRRIAYMQGGDSVDDKNYREPAGFKSDKMSETVRNTQDKHLLQDGDMNKLTREDMVLKEKLSRASDSSSRIVKKAYAGPSLTTKFTVKRDSNGAINKKASVFEVFSGGKRVIAATAGSIFGSSLPENWEWIKSAEYGKEVCKEIRASGVDYVSSLLKSAQDAAMAPAAPAPDAGAMAPMDAGMAPAEAPMPEMPAEQPVAEDEGAEEGGENPSKQIDEELTTIEETVSTVRDLVKDLEDSGSSDVDVNVFTDKDKEKGGEGSEKLALSRSLVQNLKRAYRQLDSSADELAMIAETYENINKLSSSQRKEFKKLAAEARMDSARVHGETMALVRIASSLKRPASLSKRAQEEIDMSMDDMMEDMDMSMDMAMDDSADAAVDEAKDESAELVSEAMNMRKARRESILKKAESSFLASRASARNSLLKMAEEEMEDDAKDKAHKGKKHEEDMKKDEKKEEKKEDKKEEKKSDDLNDMSAEALSSGFDMGMRSQDNMPSGMTEGQQITETVKPFNVNSSLSQRAMQKKAAEEREAYRVKLRRAYDVGMEMQKKGLLPLTKAALDKQVDDIMEFDDNAFEAFKRSVANAKTVRNMKVASDLGGVNVGVETDTQTQPTRLTADKLMGLWS